MTEQRIDERRRREPGQLADEIASGALIGAVLGFGLPLLGFVAYLVACNAGWL